MRAVVLALVVLDSSEAIEVEPRFLPLVTDGRWAIEYGPGGPWLSRCGRGHVRRITEVTGGAAYPGQSFVQVRDGYLAIAAPASTVVERLRDGRRFSLARKGLIVIAHRTLYTSVFTRTVQRLYGVRLPK